MEGGICTAVGSYVSSRYVSLNDARTFKKSISNQLNKILGVAALYYVVWALLFFRQPHYTADRKSSLTYATLWLLVVIPMIAFEVNTLFVLF